MDKNYSHEKILIIIALALGSFILLYNAFYIPSASTPSVVYVDSARNSETSNENSSDEEKQEESKEQDNAATTVVNGKINLNTATQEELADNLDGVGTAIAKRIIEYRTTYGKFSSIDEIKNVSGIGDKIFEKIKSKLCV